MKKKTLFFVYGTLKQGFGNHRVLGNAHFLGEHRTEPNYTMVSCGFFPAVHCEGDTSIAGEVYETDDPNIIASVHALEGYSGTPGPHNHFYDLKEIDTPYGKAGMFIFNGEVQRPVVISGVWEKSKAY